MAESVVKIRIDSQEYDAKLKKAGDALNRYFDTVRKGGGTLAILDEGVLDAVKAMGQMETASNSAKGKVGELTKAFTELHVQYQQLTEEEKSSPIGQEMSKSLDQLKQRLSESKTQLNNATSAINNLDNSSSQASSILDQLASKFVINIDALKLFNIGLSAARKALDVVKDAFFASESNIDEWGRTVKGAEGAYDIFLQTLNGGDWTNFFTNLSEAVRGARDLYDAFDRLGSIKNNNQAAIAILEQKLSQLRLLQQAGENVSKEIESTTKQLSALKGQSVEAGKNLGTQGAANIIRNSINANGGRSIVSDNTINAVVNEIMNVGQRAIDKYAQNYSILRKRGTRYVEQRDENGEVYTTVPVFDLKSLSAKDQWNYLISNAVKQRETSLAPYIGYYARAVNEETSTNRQEYRYNRYALQGTGGRGGGGGNKGDIEKEKTIQQQIADLEKEAYTATTERRAEIAKQVQELDKQLQQQKLIRDELHGIKEDIDFDKLFPTQEITAKARNMFEELQDSILITLSERNMEVDENSLKTLLTVAMQNGIAGLDPVFAQLQEKMAEGMDIPDTKWKEIETEINNKLKELGIEPIKIDVQTGNLQTTAKNTKNAWKEAAQAVQSVGSALQNIEDPSIKIAGLIGQAIANIALGFAQATASDSKLGVFGWIAAIAGGLATMTSTIAAIHSATGYSEGGIIKGNRYSGDNILGQINGGGYVGLNAQEIVLNRAQQGNLASQLQGNMNNLNLTATISGEQIRLALNNASRRRGRGEYVTSKTIR